MLSQQLSLDTFFQFFYTTMFKNWQGINPMGLSVPSANYKNKQLFTKMRILQTTL